MLLATVNWINAGGGDWDTAANWSSGAVPGPSDDAVINIPGITITHAAGVDDTVHSLASQDAITLSAGSLSLAAASTINGDFTLSGGILEGRGRPHRLEARPLD